MKKQGIGSHQSQKMKNDEWLTPPEIIEALGAFDLDPCSPVVRPFETAEKYYTEEDNGLMQNWEGRVWCNPPYGKYNTAWLNKMAMHKNGIALIFARTETSLFFNYVWGTATAILFIKGRLHFYYVDGTRAKANAGAPSVLIAYSDRDAQILKNCSIKGKYIHLK